MTGYSRQCAERFRARIAHSVDLFLRLAAVTNFQIAKQPHCLVALVEPFRLRRGEQLPLGTPQRALWSGSPP
jgi:hypothetical protein